MLFSRKKQASYTGEGKRIPFSAVLRPLRDFLKSAISKEKKTKLICFKNRGILVGANIFGRNVGVVEECGGEGESRKNLAKALTPVLTPKFLTNLFLTPTSLTAFFYIYVF